MRVLPKAILSQTIIQFGGRAIGFVFGIVTIGLIARLLGVEDYGRYTTIWSVLQLFGFLIDGGLNLVVAREIGAIPEENREEYARKHFPAISGFRWALNIATVLIVYGVVFAVFPFVPKYDVLIQHGTLIFTWFFIFFTFPYTFHGWWQQRLKTIYIVLIDFITKATILGGVAFLYVRGGNLEEVLWVYVIAAIAGYAATVWLLRDLNAHKIAYDKKIWKTLFEKMLPISIMMFFTVIYFKGDTVFLTSIHGVAESGIYGVVYKIMEVSVVLPQIFAGLLLPVMSGLWKKRQTESFFNILHDGVDVTLIIVIPVLIATGLFSDLIIRIVSGSEYAAAAPILFLLMIAAGIIFIAQLLQFALIAMDKQRALVKWFAIASLVSLPVYYYAISEYKSFGAAGVTILIEGIIAILYYMFLRKYGYSFFTEKSKKIILLGIFLSVITVLLIPYIQAWYVFVIDMIIFGYGLYALNIVSKDFVMRLFLKS